MKLTWFGHSAIGIELSGVKILIDPFITGAGVFEGDLEEATAGTTHILLTHGHDDHVVDAVAIASRTGAQLVAGFELCTWLGGQGVANVNPGNVGGTIDCGAFAVSFVQALHSSGTVSGGASVYLGNPMGLVVQAAGEPAVYHMGDTDIFGDMALVQDLYAPVIGIVPIGDRFTMGPRAAALACRRFFRFETILPVHHGTFPMLTGTVETFRDELGPDAARVITPPAGQAVTL